MLLSLHAMNSKDAIQNYLDIQYLAHNSHSNVCSQLLNYLQSSSTCIRSPHT